VKLYLGTLAVLFALMQLIRIDLPQKPADWTSQREIKAPEKITALLHRACYDCHSYEYKLPWYGYIAPVSWEVRRHIKNGTKWLNFQEWNSYNDEKKQKIYKGIVKTIDFRMPMPMYLKMHEEARLSKEERNAIKAWAQQYIKEEY
jgi:hypothetical protein